MHLHFFCPSLVYSRLKPLFLDLVQQTTLSAERCASHMCTYFLASPQWHPQQVLQMFDFAIKCH